MARQRTTRIPTPTATMCLSFNVLVLIVKEEILARTDGRKGNLGWCCLCGRDPGRKIPIEFGVDSSKYPVTDQTLEGPVLINYTRSISGVLHPIGIGL
ncbi:hypothetical protein DPMN_178497 [Dreissena polymorpha]|uniref:Uncharacterized protein n=1 Tax=Dreissena polymorpha TaxID=45954 RepID=A0A9D4EF58_DREPO|nr:hypothetical protein DPMN_178497 [Dreissena polymorpha]